MQDGDELYFDLTHGFRYLPMLVMVLINYSKFLKYAAEKYKDAQTKAIDRANRLPKW